MRTLIPAAQRKHIVVQPVDGLAQNWLINSSLGTYQVRASSVFVKHEVKRMRFWGGTLKRNFDFKIRYYALETRI